MCAAIFELDTVGRLPLWAQVLIASRLVRRVLGEQAVDGHERERALIFVACLAMERCAEAGTRLPAETPALDAAKELSAPAPLVDIVEAMGWAVDSVLAANDATDVSAAEAAVTNDLHNVMAILSRAPGFSALRVRILAAGDLDLLRFACGESRVGRYDGVGKAVLQRLTPSPER